MTLFRVLALSLWLLFYGSYLFKMILQRRQGIQTSRIGKGQKPPRTLWVERGLAVATFGLAAAQFISISSLPLSHPWPILQWAGFVVGLCGVALFIAAMATMRSSWRAGIDSTQSTAMVTTGVYRISRNPAFVGFDLFYLGLCSLLPNALLLAFTLLAVFVLHLQILEEEKFLPTVFGSAYLDYKRRVRRYL